MLGYSKLLHINILYFQIFITFKDFFGRNRSVFSFGLIISQYWGFPGDPVVESPPANAGDTRDMGSIPGFGRSLEKEMASLFCILT